MTRTILAIVLTLATLTAAITLGAQSGAPPPDVTWHDCVSYGTEANFAGYLTVAEEFKCKEGRFRIEGKWGDEIQNGWEYHTEFGEQAGLGPEYVGDEPPSSQMPDFQKWCPTKYGYELCGWNEELQKKEEDQRKARSKNLPKLKRDSK